MITALSCCRASMSCVSSRRTTRSIPASAQIGEGTEFGYKGIGVIVHKRAVIGKNCIIGTNVTIGGKSGHYQVPRIGDNVDISTGAKILGPITVGDGCVIGANAVVIKDCPPYGLGRCSPPRCIKAGEEYEAQKRKHVEDEGPH